ncbi:hypothetical protein ACOMHN_003794 [Nucella lapillus]
MDKRNLDPNSIQIPPHLQHQVPPVVEAVACMGYPISLVSEAYNQLLSLNTVSALASLITAPERAAALNSISAVALLTYIENGQVPSTTADAISTSRNSRVLGTFADAAYLSLLRSQRPSGSTELWAQAWTDPTPVVYCGVTPLVSSRERESLPVAFTSSSVASPSTGTVQSVSQSVNILSSAVPTTSSSSVTPPVSDRGRERSPEDEAARENGRKEQLLSGLQALIAENQMLKKRQRCRRCRMSQLEMTFLPCGHLITCQVCAETFADCPACGKAILGTVRTFMS